MRDLQPGGTFFWLDLLSVLKNIYITLLVLRDTGYGTGTTKDTADDGF